MTTLVRIENKSMVRFYDGEPNKTTIEVTGVAGQPEEVYVIKPGEWR